MSKGKMLRCHIANGCNTTVINLISGIELVFTGKQYLLVVQTSATSGIRGEEAPELSGLRQVHHIQKIRSGMFVLFLVKNQLTEKIFSPIIHSGVVLVLKWYLLVYRFLCFCRPAAK